MKSFSIYFLTARDIFSLSLFFNVTKDGKTIIERNKELNCNHVPYHCYFSADGEYSSGILNQDTISCHIINEIQKVLQE